MFNKILKSLIALSSFLFLAASYPPGANTIDPRTYGAIPNDGIDDTEAFQTAISAAIDQGKKLTPSNGRWTITNELRSWSPHGNPPTLKWRNGLMIECESREGTIIEVPAFSPNYQNVSAQKSVIMWGSTLNNVPQTGTGNGSGNEAYRNSLQDCTIEIGEGNPGARALDWVCSNRGSIRNVTIRSMDPAYIGSTGIWMGRPYPGPCFIENVEIIGFDRGTWDGQVQYGITYRDLNLRNQRIYGIDATADVVVIDGLYSQNKVPAIRSQSPSGHLVLLNANLTGGDSTKPALDLGADSKALLRDVSAAGYKSIIKQGAIWRNDLGLDITEWTSHNPISLFESANTTIKLKQPRPPIAYWSGNPNDWSAPDSFSNDLLDDQMTAQAALDSGKPIFWLPQGITGIPRWRFSGTLNVPCYVRRIIGMESYLVSHTGRPPNLPLLRFNGNCHKSDVTVIEGFWAQAQLAGGYTVEHLDARTLVIKDVQIAAGNPGIRTVPGSGPLFIEDVVLTSLHVEGSEVYAWQLNPESVPEVKGIELINATARLIGVKTEGMAKNNSPTLVALNSKLELLGGMMMPCVGLGAEDPTLGFVLYNSDAALSYTNWCGKTFDLATWDTQIREINNGTTLELPVELLPSYVVQGGNKVFVVLYSTRH